MPLPADRRISSVAPNALVPRSNPAARALQRLALAIRHVWAIVGAGRWTPVASLRAQLRVKMCVPRAPSVHAPPRVSRAPRHTCHVVFASATNCRVHLQT
eukprot:7034233-Prymnesium_polylepis.1